MRNRTQNSGSTIIPCLHYEDGPAAIEWLCRAFGFEKHAVHLNTDGTVAHAQLALGGGMVMISSGKSDTPYSKLVRQPNQVAGIETQAPYIVVSDCAAVYATAKDAGAVMMLDLENKDYGGQGFTCHDPEGHLWNIGSYDPWASNQA